MDTRYSVLMVELDCILDTRFTTLYKMGKEKVLSAFDENYYKRTTDVFPGVSREDFQAAYSRRDKSYLDSPQKTPIMEMLSEFVLETNANVTSTPFHLVPKIILNIFPYNLSEDEISNLTAALSVITRGDADIEVVNMSPEEITPKFVKKNLSILIMYEFHKWLELHSLNENFKYVTCPDVSLIGPMLTHTDKLDVELIKKCDELGIHPFQAVELIFSPLISLKLLPIEHFCMSVKLKKRT